MLIQNHVISSAISDHLIVALHKPSVHQLRLPTPYDLPIVDALTQTRITLFSEVEKRHVFTTTCCQQVQLFVPAYNALFTHYLDPTTRICALCRAPSLHLQAMGNRYDIAGGGARLISDSDIYDFLKGHERIRDLVFGFRTPTPEPSSPPPAVLPTAAVATAINNDPAVSGIHRYISSLDFAAAYHESPLALPVDADVPPGLCVSPTSNVGMNVKN